MTTPLSMSDSFSRSSCKCEIRSKYSNQLLNPDVKLVREKMPQLQNGDSLYYKYGLLEHHDYNPSSPYFLKDELSINVGSSNVRSIVIILWNAANHGSSRALITIHPGTNENVRCCTM